LRQSTTCLTARRVKGIEPRRARVLIRLDFFAGTVYIV